jgi:hypothetical protein
MKISRILFFLAWLIIFPGMWNCSSEKEMAERRNLMIPHKDELPRNSKYIGIKKRKKYKPKKKKKKQRHACIDVFNTGQSPQA